MSNFSLYFPDHLKILKYTPLVKGNFFSFILTNFTGKGLSGAENGKLETLADEERRKEREKEKEEKEIKKKNFIKKILSECQPLEGTLAEEYLRNIRGIDNIAGENLKFHPGFTTRVSCFIPSSIISMLMINSDIHLIRPVEK